MILKGLPFTCAVLAFIAAGCKKSPSESTIKRLSPVTEIKAFSASATGVGLTWTASASIQTTYGLDQYVEVRAGTAIADTLSLPVDQTSATIQGLAEGTIYEFRITFRANGSSPYPSSFPNTILWSPATRMITEGGSGQILRLYESDSQGNAQALRLYSDSVQGPLLISLGSGNQAQMDLYFNSELQLKSGSVISVPPAGRTTEFSSLQPLPANSLDTPQSFALSAGAFDSDNFNVPPGSAATGVIIFVRTQEGCYSRVLIKRGTNGALVQGSAPNRYVEIQLSYQSVPGVPYAMLLPVFAGGG